MRAIGSALTRRFRTLGYEVSVANSRGPESLAPLAAETGAHAVSVAEAARSGDVVVVTIPEKNVPDLCNALFAGVPDDVVVIDTGNYYPQQRDGRIAEIEAGMPESRWVERQLGRSLIKTFNLECLGVSDGARTCGCEEPDPSIHSSDRCRCARFSDVPRCGKPGDVLLRASGQCE